MELFKLLGIIAVENDDANREIDETTEAAEKSESKISAAFGKIGEVAGKVGKVVATGLAAGGAVVGALAKQALDSYASYEQLVGGVETLFGTRGAQSVEEYAALVGKSVDHVAAEFEMLQAAQTVAMNNAAKAYQTAGMSANDYMETISGFAASLKQSTASELEAAEVADMAIQDMADNANKMGTAMDSIQNAYQGFAKQNYTMLDNLKLGYGGTKEEMERLLEDASKLSGIKYDIGNLSDVYNAIHVIQDKLGITGTTAKEASTTIEGSLASTKAAWQNLLAGFADGNQDLNVLTANLVSSATTYAKNIVPRIAQILSGISSALPEVMTVIATELPGLMETLLPGLVDGAVALVVGLAGMLPSLVEMIFTDLPYLLSNALYKSTNPVVSAVGSFFLDIGEMWREVLQPAVGAVGRALEGLGLAFKPIFQAIQDLIPESVKAEGAMGLIRDVCFWLEDALYKVSVKIQTFAGYVMKYLPEVQAFFEKMWEGCQYVWDTIGQPLFDLAQKAVEIVRNAFSEKMPEIQEFVSQCFSDIKTFWEDNLKPCLEAIGDFIENILAPAFEYVFNEFIVDRIDTAFQFIKDLWNNSLKPIFTGITDFLTGVFTGNWEQAFQGLIDIVDGIFSGLEDIIKYPINKVIDLVNSFIKGLNKLEVPDWVPLVGGKGINIPLIPKLEQGGILKKGQMGFLEGSGDEAVVPLHQNRAWISAVAKDLKLETGGDNGKLQQIIDMLSNFFPQLVEASGHDIVTNDGVIVAHYAPKLNQELGKIASRKDRGR